MNTSKTRLFKLLRRAARQDDFEMRLARLKELPDAATCRYLEDCAEETRKQLQAMKDAGSTEHRKMAIMGTKLDLERAMATGGVLPWPISEAGSVDINGNIFEVVEV